jgi:hypothetical protein
MSVDRSMFRVPRRLYWTLDKDRLVEHDDPAAAYLAYPAGEELSPEEARRHGLLELDQPPADPEKGRASAEDKLRHARPSDKGAGKPGAKGSATT